MPLVDGIGSVSSSMMSTVGLELTNFINPDLTWKTVSKGRRTRKPVSRNLGVELPDKNAKRVEDRTVSESEKLGVAVLGRRFSDRIEHVPLKKRRTMFRSPSPPPPPQTPSPHLEVSEQQRSCLNSDGKQRRVGNNIDGKISEVTDKKLGYFEDFSGIEILAAVACDDSMGDDVNDAKDSPVLEESTLGVDSTASAMPLEKTVASLEKTNIFSEDLVLEDKVEVSSFQDNSLAVLDKSPCDKNDRTVDDKNDRTVDDENDRTVDRSVPLRDDRLHWDLNVAMDAWDQPCDFGTVDSERNVVEDISVERSEKLEILQGCEIHGEPQDINHDFVDGVVSSDLHGDNHVPPELGDLPLVTCGLDTEENKLEACSGPNRNQDVCIPVPTDNAQDPSTCSGLYNITSTGVSDQDRKTSPSSGTVKQKTEYCVVGGQLGKIFCIESVQVEESDVASPYVPVLERVNCEIEGTILNEDGKKSGRDFALHDDRSSAQEMMSVDSWQSPAPVSLEVELASKVVVGLHHFSPKCEDMSASGASAVEGQPSVPVDGKGDVDKAPAAHSTEFDSPSHDGNGPTSSSSKVNQENPFDGSCHSDVSQDGKVHVGMENSTELQAGYDSQFEDGELREPFVPCWEENEGEGGDIEYVDYESECEEERLCGLETENNEKKMKVEKGLSSGSDNVIEKVEPWATGNAFRDISVSSKTGTLEVADGSKVRERIVNCMDGPDIKEDFSPRMVGLRASIPRNRSNFIDDLYPRAVRETRDGSELHMRGRSEYNSYRGPYGSGRFRPKSAMENRRYIMDSDHTISEAAGVAGLDSRVRRQYLGSSSNGVYRPFMRKRSPANRDDAYGMQPLRDISPDRRRFRRPPQGVGRGSREEYHRSMPGDSTEYSNRMAHHLTRRERSISPVSGGRHYYTQHYKKSRSRSRSRSPGPWLLPRERNEGSRHRSRSPNFRADVRTDRVRLPFQKRFVADYEEDFMSAPRTRISPQRNSRWFDDRNSPLDNFRGRKSPGGMFRQSQRFDSVRSVRRLNSDDYVRPMIHPRRFPDVAGAGAGRGCKYEGSDDDRRRHGNRYEMIHRVRRYDTDSVARRFQYNNAEDSFVANNS